METVGILGGSFNPVHIGHMMLASFLTQWGYVDKVWLTLSPRNPLKDQAELIPDMKRLSMLSIAAKGAKDIEICDIELSMPKPSYTINTLELLRERYPECKFKLIIGSDNWQVFDQWRDADRILEEFGVMVYRRPGYPVENIHVDGLEVVNAPMVNISSTFIRNAIARGRNVNYFLPQGVYKYIQDNKLYLPTDK
ncbi:MAG: nicotinate-nucleotide adenylyltransferase [Bacteroidales bacterium]|nr:nicotinate-nucleotide adenylyltransferase [Bacteroidales bacterium]MBD5215936.1 nicotinate-nucleotide adenylyltransferase [Bacteroidales bacterium]MBD5218743.1 nicotinate-nucleotide adenylyltransferase [Bacteroidales bacterium]MDE6437987.1 nicotinate-nucleotide adenylyltransferase [Muribaculaceae bacterium]